MADITDLYPPNPVDVPRDLTRPTRSYRARVVVVLLSLLLFAGLYVGLVVGSAYLCYWSFATLARPMSQPQRGGYGNRPPARNDATGVLLIVGIASGLLCLFLVKGFFKWQRQNTALQVEVTEQDQPLLFAFIRRLCQDTRAPFPHRVYLTPDVNAAVFYNESVLSLFLPTPKNLVVGLGLVNRLNLSEFKAVLAHEFGHFSQSSMKLGSYVYRANRIIGDLVFGRDWLDDVVGFLRRIDIRIAIFAWIFTGILWVLRKTLQGLFRLMTFANSSLSRQMEFNADLMAVRVTGSDALIHGLARLDLASAALNQAWADLTAAADHQLYTRDLFYHQTRAADYLRGLRNDSRLGEPPALPANPAEAVQVFQPEDTSVPLMWATHPTNHDREANAKRHYVRSPIDERSPWVLFQDAPAVCEQVTLQLYQVTRPLEEVKPVSPEVVQAFIDDEHAETTYHARYHGLYDNRYLTPGDFDVLLRAAAEDRAAGPLVGAQACLYDETLQTRMEAHRARQQESAMLARLVNGAAALTGKDFPFRGGRHLLAEAKPLLDRVEKEINADFAWMEELDRRAFLVHYAMARELGADVLRELEERYRFHLAVQAMLSALGSHSFQVQTTLNQFAGERELSQGEFQNALAVMRQAHDALRESLDWAAQLRLPVLKNMQAGAPLGPFLLSRPLLDGLSERTQSLDGKWIGKLLQQMGEVIDKTKRIHFKSLGGVLALQEKIAERWSSAPAADAGLAAPPSPPTSS